MQVVFFTNNLGYGGAEKNLALVANHLCSIGWDITIVLLDNMKIYQNIDKRINTVQIKKINKRILKRFYQIIEFKKFIEKTKPDVIISFLFFPNVIATIAGKITDIPNIISERGDPSVITDKRMKFLFRIFKYAKGAVFQTYGAASYYDSKLQERGIVISNPIMLKDKNISHDFANEESFIAYVARFENIQKRQDIMIKAFKIVREKHKNIRLKFFGDGPDEDKMKNLAEEMNVSDFIDFMGVSDNIAFDIHKAKMFVLTSDYEGIPNTLLEAMALGLPVVATDCSPGGAKMLIRNMENGILVNKGDVNAISDAICFYLDNKEIAEKYGNEARIVLKDYSFENIINKWINYIIKVVSE